MRANRRYFLLLALTCAISPVANADKALSRPLVLAVTEVVANANHLRMLRQGGFVLYLRHGATDNTRTDRVPDVDLGDCSTQRVLSDDGKKQARLIGEALRRARVPLGEVRVSPMCRTVDTAEAMQLGVGFTVDNDLRYTSNLTSAQKSPILANTRRWLSTTVPEGTNRLLVGHAPNLMDMTGYFPKEGTLSIFRPLGEGRFEYIASIPSAQWVELLRQAAP